MLLIILDDLVRVKSNIRVFHKLDEIGNNVNTGIRGFTTWNKNPVTKCYMLTCAA